MFVVRGVLLSWLSLRYVWAYSDIQCDDGVWACCDVSESNGCMLSDLSTNQSTLIFPGGDTACISSASTPFAFQVYRGDSDKVLFYFQGGGACWDQNSLDNSGYGVKNPFCRTDALPWPVYGVFDKSDPRNAYNDYTIVNVLYCSGDNHAGNAVRNFTDVNGNYAVQRGGVNVQSVLEWMLAQQRAGHLSSTLENLVVMGCSAGALASQIWGNEVIKQLNYPKRAAIVPDSYVGLFPPGLEGQLIFEYGMCELDFLPGDAKTLCREKKVNTSYLVHSLMQASPHVPYLFLHSRADRVQIKYYNYLVDSYGLEDQIDEDTFVDEADAILVKYNNLSNFLVYYVDSTQHCFTPTPYLFFADTDGISSYEQDDDNDDNVDDDIGGGGVNDDDVYSVDIEEETMNKWLTRIPLSLGKSISSQCTDGLCSSGLVPKQYLQVAYSSAGSGGKGSNGVYAGQSDYKPSGLVVQMHNVPHLDSRFNEVDSTFNVTRNMQWSSYTESLVTVPVLIFAVGVFGLLVFLFFLCIRSSSFTYTRFNAHEDMDEESVLGSSEREKGREPTMLPPDYMITTFWACVCAAFVLNMLIFVGNARVSEGVGKGDDSLYHLEYAFEDLQTISTSLLDQGADLSDLFDTAEENGCDRVSYASSYLGDYDQRVQSFSYNIEPIEPKVVSARKKIDSYAVDKKNGLVFTIFAVVTVSLLLFVVTWKVKSVVGLKASIGISSIVVFMGLIFATLYMIFLIALGDFCMDPTSYARSIASAGGVEEAVQYYTSCQGVNPAEYELFNAEYASNVLLYYVNTLSTTVCPDDESLQNATANAEQIAVDMESIMTIADCAPYKEYWETFFNEGMCSDIFVGLFLIWITQTLAIVFLFAVAVIASLMYPYLKLSRKQLEMERLGISSHHSAEVPAHTMNASSSKNPMFELVNAR